MELDKILADINSLILAKTIAVSEMQCIANGSHDTHSREVAQVTIVLENLEIAVLENIKTNLENYKLRHAQNSELPSGWLCEYLNPETFVRRYKIVPDAELSYSAKRSESWDSVRPFKYLD